MLYTIRNSVLAFVHLLGNLQLVAFVRQPRTPALDRGPSSPPTCAPAWALTSWPAFRSPDYSIISFINLVLNIIAVGGPSPLRSGKTRPVGRRAER